MDELPKTIEEHFKQLAIKSLWGLKEVGSISFDAHDEIKKLIENKIQLNKKG